MRHFTCDCGWRVWFDNVACLNCGRALGFFLPDHDMLTLGKSDPENSTVFEVRGQPGRYVKKCRNYRDEAVCNWVFPIDSGRELCQSCNLNRTIPNLSVPGNRWYWYRLEKAKRRLLYSLSQLGLPIEREYDGTRTGMVFRFVSDDPQGRAKFAPSPKDRVMTGHADGVITINIAEADDPSRVEMQAQMGEDYRTLLGHFRHESGHYYWSRLVEGGPWEKEFVAVFGDHTVDYERARESHYQRQQQVQSTTGYISKYSTMHPWEDWAETWAHYLKMISTLETAQANRMLSYPFDLPAELRNIEHGLFRVWTFDQLTRLWTDLTAVTNELGLSLGYDRYLYPFILHPPVIEKLRLIHRIIRAQTPESVQH